MENYKKELAEQLVLLRKLCKVSDDNIKKLRNIPDESIWTSSKGSFHQYYRKDQKSGKRIYLGREKLDEIRLIVQKEYEQKVNNEVHSQIKRLERFLNNSDVNTVIDIYENASSGKKNLITPIIMPDEEYIEKWFKANLASQNPYPAKATFETMNGELVKSKSEKIIADTMIREGIPYVYEPRLVLDGRISKYPDFVTLNVRKRKTIYWEHFGRLSDEGYCLSNFNKLMIYERNGIILGENLIITMESEDMPLEMQSVKNSIERYLK